MGCLFERFVNIINKIMNKKIIFSIILFFLVFLISFIMTYVLTPITFDEVWIYGFTYNVSKGMVIYRDFNVVTTPLYYFIGSIFIKIFGNYMIVLGIFNALIVSFIVLMMFSIIKWKAFIVFPLILIYAPNGYNLLSLFFLMLILFLINKKKDNDVFIGYILGLLFITKQSIGLCLIIPYLFYSKNRLKGIIAFIIPFMIISVYLLYYGGFYDFINYCFLGLFEFGTNNYYFSLFAVIEIFVLIYLVFKLIKCKFHDKELFYILMFQFIIFPLPDQFHFFVALFPVVYYIVKNINNKFFLWEFFLGIGYFTVCVFFCIDISINLKKDMFFLRNAGELSDLMEEFHTYLEDIEYYYFTGYHSYFYKLYYDIPIGKFDLWNEGNHGYNGIERKIKELDEICKNNECVFIVNKDLGLSKTSQLYKICNYVTENYFFIEEISDAYVYSNRINVNIFVGEDIVDK